MNLRRSIIGTVILVPLIVLSACSSGSSGSSSESDAPTEANVFPAVSGISDQEVQSALGADCATSRDLRDEMGVDLYFGYLAEGLSQKRGGSATEWRAAIDWWWETKCGGQ